MNFDKIQKVLDEDTIKEMESMNEEQLKAKIITAEQGIKQAKDELDANAEYQELKENIKAVRSGFSAVKKRQNAIINLALLMLEGQGKA